MIKKIKIINNNEEYINEYLEDDKKIDIVFRKLIKDYVGRSSSNPTWGYVFNVRDGKLKLNVDGEGLYKEFDYDNPNAAFSEKIASIMGKEILENTRVPKVDIVEENVREPSIISYKLMDNDKEDMYHISTLMYYKYDREQLSKKRNIFTIEDILECVRVQIEDEENYKQVEKSIIHTLLFDSIINNGDRHNNNWAIVVDKKNGKYDLAIFDHSSSFIDMIAEQPRCVYDGWVGSYITDKDIEGKHRKDCMGKAIIENISQNYKDFFNEFCDIYDNKLPIIIEKIKEENLPIDKNRLEQKLKQRNNYLKKIKNREEYERGE